jgi:hypothetical protein
MRKQFLLHALIFIMISFSLKVKSSSEMGSDITWECVGQDSFLVTLTLYRDCNSTSMDTATINVKCNTSSQTLQTLRIARPQPIDITPVCESSCSRCDSSGCSFPYGIEMYRYQKLLVLDTTSCCKIILSWSSCCRSLSLISGLAGTSLWTDATFDRCLTPCDNSPKFKIPPIAIACIGQDFTFNNGAFDTDTDSIGGLTDSLVYEWIYPKGAGGQNLSYTSPYDYDKPVYFWGFPNTNLSYPRGFHLDPSTGDIGFRPMKVEQTVMAIKVSEYRNGQKIGEVTRDIQIIVISCPNNQSPILSGPFYKETCEGSTVTFNIRTMDYDPNDSLTISWDNTIAGATWSENNDFAKHPTGTVTWTPPPGSASNIPYVFHVTVKDDACPVMGTSTKTYQILVKKTPQIDMRQPKYLGCGAFQFMLEDSSLANWEIEGTSYHNNNMVVHKFNNSGYFNYLVTKTNSLCTFSYYDSVYVPDYITVELPQDTVICNNSSVQISAIYNSNVPISRILWSTGDSNTNLITLNSLKKDTIIKITVYNDSGCVASDSMKILVDNFKVSPFQLYPVCNGEEAIVYTNPVFDIGKQIDSIKWIGLKCGCIKGRNDTFKTYYNAPFAVVAYNENGCMATDTITTVVHPLPNIISTLPKQLCDHDQIIQLDSFIEPLGGSWILLGNTGLNKNQLDLSKLDSGSYVLFYEFTDSNTHCYNDLQIGFRVKEIPNVSTKEFDSICSKTGDYLLNGLPNGGNWSGNIVSHSGSQYYVNTDSVNVNNSQLFPMIYSFTDSSSCSNQDTLNLTIIETKNISFQNMKGCMGDDVELEAIPAGGLWIGNGVSGTKLITTQTGIGDHKVFYLYDNMGCPTLDSVFINIISYPDGNIYISHDSIIVGQGYSRYQWFRNDSLLNGEINYYIIPNISGNYHCNISNNYDCLIATQKIIFSSVSEFLQKDFSVYPNPVINGLLTIDVSKLNLSNFNLLILDELGKQVYFEEITNNAGKTNRKINSLLLAVIRFWLFRMGKDILKEL